MGSRCTGHCCRHFHLPFSPEELWKAYRDWQANGAASMAMSGGHDLKLDIVRVYQDIHLIAPMVIYLGRIKRPYPVVNKLDAELVSGKVPIAHFYTCKHLGADNNCTIYDDRPAMCKNYPDEHKCEYAGCTWTKHKEKKETVAQTAERKRLAKKAVADKKKAD